MLFREAIFYSSPQLAKKRRQKLTKKEKQAISKETVSILAAIFQRQAAVKIASKHNCF